MKVALLQINLDHTSEAENLQRINAAIHAAAGGESVIDLLVLPGTCDTGGASADRLADASAAERMKANLSSKAREWGVYLAAGLHAPHGNAVVPCSYLFDPDGDTVARSAGADKDEDAPAAPTIDTWTSTVGTMAVLDPDGETPLFQRLSDAVASMLVAVPASVSWTGSRQKRSAANIEAILNGAASESGAYWAVVSEARPDGSGGAAGSSMSFLCAPDGKVLAEAAGPEEQVLYVDVPLEQPVKA